MSSEGGVGSAAVARPACVRLTEQGVLERLRAIARDELQMRPEEADRVGPETPLLEGLQLDSLRQVVLLTAVEEQFGLELSLDDHARMQSLRTIDDLVGFIWERVASP